MNFFFSKLLENVSFDFVKYRKLSFLLSISLVFITIVLFSAKGMNFGIDFTGGLVFEISSKNAIDIAEVEETLVSNSVTVNHPSVHHLENIKSAVIKIKSENSDEDIKIIKSLLSGYDFEYQKIDYVGPQISKSLITRGAAALLFSLFAIFGYLTFRFNYIFGLGGIVSLIHDVIIVCGIYSLFSIEFCTSSVAALLTIIGYSINDSVVIFDKIRENTYKIKNRAELVNLSINKTLSRTILTSFSTIITIIPIIFFSQGEVKDFATVILSGIIIGTYSSIFISAPITLFNMEKELTNA